MLKQSFSVLAGVTALGLGFAASAEAAGFTVTAEAPGVQESSLLTDPNAQMVQVNDFDDDTLTFGTYSDLPYFGADQFGGAGGTGRYITTELLQDSEYTLTLDEGQKYLGFWWSAGDGNNQVEFFSGGQSIFSFDTQSVLDFLDGNPNEAAYFGNPNSGEVPDEPFVFLNFFAQDGHTFDKVVFSGDSFESDNHTIAKEFGDNTTGELIPTAVPEPASMLGLLAVGVVAAGSTLKRKRSAEA